VSKRCGALLLVWIAISAFAAAPADSIATISSEEPVRLRGVHVPVAGIGSWPLVAGDDIATGSAPAVVLFRDGSRVTLAPNSRARLDLLDSKPEMRLLGGFLHYSRSESSSLRIIAQGSLATGNSGTASASAVAPSAAPAFNSPVGAGRLAPRPMSRRRL
jgi:hypothetical protein